MKKRCLVLLLLAALSVTSACGQSGKRVVLITIDGFRPDFYLDPAWGAVNLRQMKEAGVCARALQGIFPTVTFPSHTTLVTGVNTRDHGIYYNDPFEVTGPTGDWYWHFRAIKSPTLWEVAKKAGLKTASVLWPVTAGAPIDYNIPDIWEAGLADRREITARYANPPGLWDELERNATGRLEANDFNLTADYLAMDENIARMAGYLIRKYKPHFTTVHLPAVDHAEHADGRDGDEVRRAVAGVDRSVRTIIEAIDKAGLTDSTVLIITGDHGFANRERNFYPNVLLARAGLITDISKGEWKARFHTSGGSAFLYLKDKGDRKSLSRVKQLINALPEDQKKFLRVIEGDELARAEVDPEVQFALSAAPGTAFGAASDGELIRVSRGGTHGHFPDTPGIQTGFIASGPGLRKGAQVEGMSMVDVAPLIAHILGVSLGTPADRLKEQVLSD